MRLADRELVPNNDDVTFFGIAVNNDPMESRAIEAAFQWKKMHACNDAILAWESVIHGNRMHRSRWRQQLHCVHKTSWEQNISLSNWFSRHSAFTAPKCN